MSEAWVIDASLLVLFADVRRLALIERLAPAILIPNAVLDEVRAGQEKDRTAAAALAWGERYRVEDIAVVASIEDWDIGLGESQVIARSIGGWSWAVLDDPAARRCAVARAIPVIGSLGVILRSKRNRHIDRVRPMVKERSLPACFWTRSSSIACWRVSENEDSGRRKPERSRALDHDRLPEEIAGRLAIMAE